MDDTIPQDTLLKQCTKCLMWKPATAEFFHQEKRNPDGFRPDCKDCRNLTKRHTVPKGYKQCNTCQQVLPAIAEYFTQSLTEKYGLCGMCRACRRKQPHPVGVFPPEGQFKQCKNCLQTYPATLEYFSSNSNMRDHLNTWCKRCDREAKKRRFVSKRPIYPPGFKECRGCKQLKPATTEYFPLFKKRRLASRCRECVTRERVLRSLSHIYPPVGQMRQCRTCSVWKPATLEFFQSNKHNQDHLSFHCKVCVSLKRKEAYERDSTPFRAKGTNRYMRQKGVPGKHTAQDIRDQFKRQKGRCYYCGKKLDKKYEVDHVIPVTREGSSNDPWNLVVTCPHCNSSKSDKLPHEWFEGGRLM